MGRKCKRKPCFFKILLGDFSQCLQIPPSFMKHIMAETSESATLEGPSGSNWDVKLDRTAKGTFFRGGWAEFVKEHSLQAGEFLVFRYNGNLHFTGQIFGVNACEREDLFTVKAPQNPNSCKGKKKQRKVVKRPFECSHISQLKALKNKSKYRNNGLQALQTKPTQQEYSNPILHTQGKIKAEPISSDLDDEVAFQPMFSTVENGTSLNCEDAFSSKSNGCPQRKMELIDMALSGTGSCHRGFRSTRGVVTEEKTSAWTAAIAFKPNRPHFMIDMKASFVCRVFILEIPRSFAREYLPTTKTKLIFHDPRGKEWEVKYIPERNYRHAITGGWKAFSRANNLVVDDVCVFELIKKYEMRVHIFRDDRSNPKCDC